MAIGSRPANRGRVVLTFHRRNAPVVQCALIDRAVRRTDQRFRYGSMSFIIKSLYYKVINTLFQRNIICKHFRSLLTLNGQVNHILSHVVSDTQPGNLRVDQNTVELHTSSARTHLHRLRFADIQYFLSICILQIIIHLCARGKIAKQQKQHSYCRYIFNYQFHNSSIYQLFVSDLSSPQKVTSVNVIFELPVQLSIHLMRI